MNEYTVLIGGIEHTMLLDEADAKRLDAKAVKPANKAAAPQNKGHASGNRNK